MSQRDSGYERINHDQYETPAWATEALLPHIPTRIRNIWEPACGNGKMVSVLAKNYPVTATDVQKGLDFLSSQNAAEAIVTNPPYAIATEFINHALLLTQKANGFVAMLLRCDFDHAKSRANLFSKNKTFAKKLVLTRRIRWIEGSKGSPSFNHAWFVWDWTNGQPPSIAYDL